MIATYSMSSLLSKVALVVMLLCLCASATAAGWTSPIEVTYIQAGSGRYYAHIPENVDGCPKGNWYVISEGDKSFTEIVANLMLANALRRTVRFYSPGCSPDDYSRLAIVRVEPPTL